MMQHIEYRRTFSQFIDNYLSTYYSAGGQGIRRVVQPLILMSLGGVMVVLALPAERSLLLKTLLGAGGAVLFLYGLVDLLRPIFNILLVWLRRDEFLGDEGAIVSIRLSEAGVQVSDPDGSLEIPLEQIRSLQHRADSSWIITTSDHMIYLPRHNLLSGDHDAFVAALDELLDTDEED